MKTTGLITFVAIAFKAVVTMSLRNSLSLAGDNRGSPQGWGILTPLMDRGTFSWLLKTYIGVTIPTGRPALSISRASADPLREHVPQVDVKTTPVTPSAFISSAISLPICSITFMLPRTPGVT